MSMRDCSRADKTRGVGIILAIITWSLLHADTEDRLRPRFPGRAVSRSGQRQRGARLVMVFAASQSLLHPRAAWLDAAGDRPRPGLFTEHPDSPMSRRHARVSFRDQSFVVTDLDSRNGSAVDGVALHGTTRVAPGDLSGLAALCFIAVPISDRSVSWE